MTVYCMWSKHLMPPKRLNKVSAWFDTVAASDSRMKEITSQDLLDLIKDEWVWKPIVLELLGESPNWNSLSALLRGGHDEGTSLFLFPIFSGTKQQQQRQQQEVG